MTRSAIAAAVAALLTGGLTYADVKVTATYNNDGKASETTNRKSVV